MVLLVSVTFLVIVLLGVLATGVAILLIGRVATTTLKAMDLEGSTAGPPKKGKRP